MNERKHNARKGIGQHRWATAMVLAVAACLLPLFGVQAARAQEKSEIELLRGELERSRKALVDLTQRIADLERSKQTEHSRVPVPDSTLVSASDQLLQRIGRNSYIANREAFQRSSLTSGRADGLLANNEVRTLDQSLPAEQQPLKLAKASPSAALAPPAPAAAPVPAAPPSPQVPLKMGTGTPIYFPDPESDQPVDVSGYFKSLPAPRSRQDRTCRGQRIPS